MKQKEEMERAIAKWHILQSGRMRDRDQDRKQRFKERLTPRARRQTGGVR